MADNEGNDLNEMKKKALRTDMGVNAHVERQDFTGEHVKKGNQNLKSIGESVNPKPGTSEYLGSVAIHVYKTPMLEQIFYVSQVGGTVGQIPESLAPYVARELTGAMQEHYRGKRQKWRSGL